MILVWLIIIPILGGFTAWAIRGRNDIWPRWISIVSLTIDLVLALGLWSRSFGQFGFSDRGSWLAEINLSWIPQIGISLHLAMDSLSLLMVVLTIFLGIISVACSWKEIRERVGFFHFNLLWTLAGIIGVFLSMDLFLFYFFWELMLVPMYFLIAIWGHENRIYASIKFFIFTQLSGLLMLASILGLYFIHGRSTGIYTFDYFELLGTSLPSNLSMWLMLGFFMAFAVKLPLVPFHTWLPDAHTEAPTAGSVILAGLLLKTGAYGFLRFFVPLFPSAVIDYSTAGMILGVTGILYGAIMAFSQTDLKRLVAYTSVSHMGFVIFGISAWNELALQGVVMQMLCHGISTGALFIIVGFLQERIHTRDIGRMSGLWSIFPRMGGMAMLFSLASLGLPGLGNFIGEFLVLIGSYKVNIFMTVLATTGLVFATVYALWIIQKVFHGEKKDEKMPADLSSREMSIMTIMVIIIIWLGLYPQPVLDKAGEGINNLRRIVDFVSIKDSNKEKETVTLLLSNPPQSPFLKGGNMFNTPLWKRGVRGDFKNAVQIQSFKNFSLDRCDIEYKRDEG